MEFTEDVQKGKVVGPLRRGFDLAKWHQVAASRCTDERDKNLALSGEWVFTQLELIRKSLRLVNASTVDSGAKLRAFIGLANYNFWALSKKHRAFTEQAAKSNNTVLTTSLISKKHTLPIGADFSVDEINQTAIDGTQIPIKVVLGKQDLVGGSPNFKGISADDLILDANLGALYDFIESIWNDLLWNDYRLEENEKFVLIRPANDQWIRWHVGSEFRRDNLNFQFFHLATKDYFNLPPEAQTELIGVRLVESIEGSGKNQVIKLGRDVLANDLGARLAVAKIFAIEEYYEDIIRSPLESIPGATLEMVMAAWTVASSASDALRRRIEGQVDNQSGELPADFYVGWVGTLKTRDFCIVVSKALAVPLATAVALVDFLTYKGLPSQELWAQPLVTVGSGRLAPVFGAASSPNMRRLTDVWMSQLGLDLGERGPAFESHIKNDLKTIIADSPLLSESKVVAGRFVLRPEGDRPEEIDLVIIIGSLVIVGELKCIRQPTEAKERAMHRSTVLTAISQIQRKVAAIARHGPRFREQLNAAGHQIPAQFKLLPIVLLNSPTHAAFDIDGIPIIDLPILRIFFEGKISMFALSEPGKAIRHLQEEIIYTNKEEAIERALEYFSSPPQTRYIWQNIVERPVPVMPPPGAEGKPAVYQTYEVRLPRELT